MSRAAVAVALVLVLVVSVLVGFGAAVHGASAGPSASAAAPLTAATNPALPPIIVHAYNGQQQETNDFCTGSCITSYGPPPDSYPNPGANTILFTVYDAAGDHTVNLTLNDPNATRDGLGSPVFSATVTINSTTDSSTYAMNHLSYIFPSSLVYGGYWNVTVSAPLGGTYTEQLTVHTYTLAASTNPRDGGAVLPGEQISLNWWIQSTVNGASYDKFTALTLWGEYLNGTYQNLFTPGMVALPVQPTGAHNFTIPNNASEDSTVYIELWAVANVSGFVTENETYSIYLYVGAPWIDYTYLTPYADCGLTDNQTTFSAGSTIFVTATAGVRYGGYFQGVPGLTVSDFFTNGIGHVSPGGSVPTSLVSSATGVVCFAFTASVPPFTTAYGYPFGNSVNLTVADTAATSVGNWKGWSNFTFQLTPSSQAAAIVQVSLSSSLYSPGQNVVATWNLGSTNATIGTLTATGWAAWGPDTDGLLLGTGTISSTAQNGQINITLPSDYVGDFEVLVTAVNATETFSGEALSSVVEPQLLVSGPTYYTPGNTLTWSVQFSPAALSGTTTYYTVTGEWYNPLGVFISSGVVAQGTLGSSNSVSYTVPGGLTATYYDLDVWAQSPTSGVYATGSWEADLETGFTVLAGVSTQSNYADGSFQPGQTIQVTWQVTSFTNQPVPSVLYVEVGIEAGFAESEFETTSTSGSVSLTLPSNLPSGSVYIYVDVDAYGLADGPNCYMEDNNYGYCYADTSVYVNAHPSALSEELGAGSGLTVGWLLLLVIILVVAVILVLIIRHGRSPPKAAPWNEGNSPMNPPTPAPTAPPAAEWQAPGTPPATGGSPPPLPPPGSQ
jgi:hypothetical protein